MVLNHKNNFVSIVMAAINHPRLNTDEYLMISIRFVLFNCNILPINIDSVINIIKYFFICNKIRKIGANFWHVISRVN